MSPGAFDAFVLPPGVPIGEYETIGVGGGPVTSYRIPHIGAGEARTLTDLLRSAGEALSRRSPEELAAVLGGVGARFLDPEDAIRREALDLLPATAGLSPEMSVAVLDGMAADWTEACLLTVLDVEFGGERVGLIGDGRGRDGPASRRRGSTRISPALCVQIVSGSVPGVSVNAMLRALLVGSPTLVKPGLGDVVLPVLFARGLREVDEHLSSALAVTYWPGGTVETEDDLMAAADVVVLYGSDETVRSVRSRAPATARVVAYHNRVSVAVVGREVAHRAAEVADELAGAVAVFDHRGCVCPQIVFVEEGGCPPEEFAELLARAMSDVEECLPPGLMDIDEAAALHQWRGNVELWEATGVGRVFHGGEASSWTVVYDPELSIGGASTGRSIRVHPVPDADVIPDLLEPIGSHLQTVGYAGLTGRIDTLAIRFGRRGASRVVPLRDMAFPPPWWLHDGRGPLTDLVRWVELERE